MDDAVLGLTVVSALGCGLVAGAFFAFSTFVIKALGRIQPRAGIIAMQEINIVVINPWFLTALFGPSLTCAVLAVLAALEWDEPEVFYQLAGSAFYVIGTILVTIGFNVPRNDALAAVEPGTAAGEAAWRRYLAEWTAWNHVRTATAFAAAALLTIALI